MPVSSLAIDVIFYSIIAPKGMMSLKSLLGTVCGLAIVVSTVLSGTPAQAQSAKKTTKSSSSEKKQTSKLSPSVLARAGSEDVTYGQLEEAYRKTMTRKDSLLVQVPRDSVYEFLNMYVNYRLKVQEALSLGFAKDSAVLADIRENRAALAPAFLLEKKLTDPSVEMLLDRRQRELKIAVILINVAQEPGADTLVAYNKALGVIKRLKAGEDFAKLALDSSDDEQSRTVGGEIPFITGGMILREVEDAAFAMKPGQYTQQPVRTRFGYFVIKLIKDEPRQRVRGSHILISTTAERDSTTAYQIADSLRRAIIAGKADFATVAKDKSDDRTSATRGGDLTSFYTRSLGFESGPGRLVPEFENALYKLRDGDISPIVHTTYGFHIIRRDSTKTFTRADERETVKKLYKRQYFEQDRERFVDSLRKAYGYAWNEPVLRDVLSHVDSTKSTLDTAWVANLGQSLRSSNLYGAPRDMITVQAFVDSVKKRSDMRGIPLTRDGFDRAMKRMTEAKIMARATDNLEQQYPEFAALMKEYADALLAFRIEDQEVWSKLKFDSTRARVYYDSTKSKYMTETKYDLTEIFVTSDTLAQSIYSQATRVFQTDGKLFEQLAAEYTQRRGLREKSGKIGAFSAKENRIAAAAAEKQAKPNDVLGPIKMDNGYVIARVNSIEFPRVKTFEEAISDFAVAFQDLMQKQLTRQWLERLREKYPVAIKNDTINSIWSHGG